MALKFLSCLIMITFCCCISCAPEETLLQESSVKQLEEEATKADTNGQLINYIYQEKGSSNIVFKNNALDDNKLEPMERTAIVIENDDNIYSALTDETGFFTIANIKPDLYDLRIKTLELPLRIFPGLNQHLQKTMISRNQAKYTIESLLKKENIDLTKITLFSPRQYLTGGMNLKAGSKTEIKLEQNFWLFYLQKENQETRFYLVNTDSGETSMYDLDGLLLINNLPLYEDVNNQKEHPEAIKF